MQSHSKVLFAAALLLFVLGAGVFCYPVVSNWLAEKNQAQVVQSYEEAVSAEDRHPVMVADGKGDRLEKPFTRKFLREIADREKNGHTQSFSMMKSSPSMRMHSSTTGREVVSVSENS